MTTRTKKILSYSFLILLLVVGEFFARYYLGLGTPPLSISHPSIEYMYKPDQDVRRFGNHIYINSYGMRSRQISINKQVQEERRILIFGDSVINGGSLTDQSELATSLLEKELSKRYRDEVIVGNVSAGSWGPGNWLAYAEIYGFFDADSIIVFMSNHDMSDNPSFTVLNPNTHPIKRPISALMEGFTRYLPRYLHKSVLMSAQDELVLSRQIERGFSDLKEFLMLAVQSAQDVSIVLWPEKRELQEDSPGRSFILVENLCIELNIRCLSLWNMNSEAIKGKEIYLDNIHPNVYGQRLIAQALIEHLDNSTND